MARQSGPTATIFAQFFRPCGAITDSDVFFRLHIAGSFLYFNENIMNRL